MTSFQYLPVVGQYASIDLAGKFTEEVRPHAQWWGLNDEAIAFFHEPVEQGCTPAFLVIDKNRPALQIPYRRFPQLDARR